MPRAELRRFGMVLGPIWQYSPYELIAHSYRYPCRSTALPVRALRFTAHDPGPNRCGNFSRLPRSSKARLPGFLTMATCAAISPISMT